MLYPTFEDLNNDYVLENDINQDDVEDTTTTDEETTTSSNTTVLSTTSSTTSSSTETSTTDTLPEEDGLSYEAKLGLGLGGGALLLILVVVSIVIFMYVRGKRRKIQGAYNPAYLEQLEEDRTRQLRKKMNGPFVIPLPQPERLI